MNAYVFPPCSEIACGSRLLHVCKRDKKKTWTQSYMHLILDSLPVSVLSTVGNLLAAGLSALC